MKAVSEFDEIVVFGARGFTVLILNAMEEYWQGRVRIVALIDDIENGFSHPQLGIPVISSEERLRDYPDVPVMLTPGSGALRAKVTERLVTEGATLATAICPDQGHVDRFATFGAACLCVPFTRIGPGVTIGAGAQVLATAIAHDVEIGAFSTLGGHSSVLGNVVIGEGVHIAPYAVIGNGAAGRPLHIGDGAIIGVGAVITGNVPAGSRMIGNPAMTVEHWRKLRRFLADL